MNKDKKIFLGILLLLLIFMIFGGILIFKGKKVEIDNLDAINFKKEYEDLNNVVNEQTGKTNKEISIATDNPVDIVSEEEAVTLLEKGTGILYMGFPECPWCRSLLPVLLKTLDNVGIQKLSYLNISNIRDTLAIDDKNNVEVLEEGTVGYYKILDLLDEVLEPFYLTNNEDQQIDTKEKRVYAPTVVGVKEGKIVGIHVSTVESQTDPYADLTQEQEEELSNAFLEIINKVYDINCDEAC